jgi:hypothetical protein
MMTAGSLSVQVHVDDAGVWTATVWFAAAGGGEPYQIGDVLTIADGSTITIDPTCVQCELQTTVSSGQVVLARRPGPAPAAARHQPAAPPRPGGPK